MTGQPTVSSPERDFATEVPCPHCEHPVAVPVPDRDVEPVASPYVAAFGEHRVVDCPAGHEFWVYYC